MTTESRTILNGNVDFISTTFMSGTGVADMSTPVLPALSDNTFKDAVRTMLSAPKAEVQASMAAEKAERATKRGK